MSFFTEVMCIAGVFWLLSASLFRMNKALRAKRGALVSDLNLHDHAILFLTSVIFSSVLHGPSLLVTSVTALALSFYGLLLWLDALLFVQFRIEINRQTLAWFFTGSKGISKGIPHLLAPCRIHLWAAFLPIAWIALVWSIFFIVVKGNPVKSENVYFIAALGVAALGSVAVVLYTVRRWLPLRTAFFTAPSLLGKVFADDNFSGDDTLAIYDEHRAFVAPPATGQKKSELFGQCAGANIILITMESLGNYLASDVQDGVRSLLAKRFKENAWHSQQHFCLCPNTTVSTNQMYTGAYSNNPYNREDSMYPGVDPQHIARLKECGYTTMFLDSADIGLYDYHKLLNRIGFDHIWGTQDLPGRNLRGDYRLWNMVDTVASKVADKPFFLHLINDQTHMPYEVIDKQRFNRHKGRDARATYLNAAEEVDYIFDTFIKRLAEKVDLSNTLLVFTGDHGESFGEYGYSFHSNSVILPQMQVPFMMSHPALNSRVLRHSSHFDLFPTFFDLLGLEYSHKAIGQSLAVESRPFAYLFHSATLKGNTPANFGFLFEGELYWVDRLFNQVRHVQANQRSTTVAGKQREYICSLLYQMLKQRAILS